MSFQNYIGGRWVDAASGETLRARVPPPARSSAASRAPAPRTWTRPVRPRSATGLAARAGPKRAEILFRAANLLPGRRTRSRADEEMGKVLKEARGDIQEAIDMTYYMAGEGRRTFGQTTPSELPRQVRDVVRAPVGVVGCITPWNFPMAIPSWKIMPALVTGNTVVFKPSQYSPKSAYNLVEDARRGRAAAGRRQPRLRRRRGGRRGDHRAPARAPDLVHRLERRRQADRRACGRARQAVSLEMGGKNAIIVLDDADLDLALDGVALERVRHDRPALHRREPRHRARGVYDDVRVEARRARARRLRLGNGLDEATDVGPVVNRDAARQDRLATWRSAGRRRDARRRRRARERRGRSSAATSSSRPSSPTRAGDAHRAGGDLRAGDGADPRRGARRGDRGRTTGSATASRRRSTRATSTRRSARSSASRPASST